MVSDLTHNTGVTISSDGTQTQTGTGRWWPKMCFIGDTKITEVVLPDVKTGEYEWSEADAEHAGRWLQVARREWREFQGEETEKTEEQESDRKNKQRLERQTD